MLGKSVLLIDIDPQGNCSSGLGVDRSRLKTCIYDILIRGIDPQDVIVRTDIRRLDLIPATIQLAGAEVELATVERRETRLKEQIDPLRNTYDYIIIDCPRLWDWQPSTPCVPPIPF